MRGSTRREFLTAAAVAGGALALGGATRSARAQGAGGAPKKLKILVLGGTRFVGLHFVEAALAHGHEVTCFTRGRTNSDAFEGRGVEMLIGNRDPNIDEGLTALQGRDWDAVFDTTSYVKRIAEAAAETLKGHVGHYVNITSISVYKNEAKHGLTEEDELATIEDESVETVDGVTYGALKAVCERTFTEAFGPGTTNIRPGFIVGPDDYVPSRFPLWCARVQRGGELIAPGNPSDPVQLIDARDLADFSLRCMEENLGGAFNAVGPAGTLRCDEFCYGLGSCVSDPIDWTWVPAPFLAERNLIPIPWLPPDDPESGGFSTVSNAKAIAAGMTFRPLARTVLDTLAWMETMPESQRKPIDDFFAANTEANVLAEWKAQQSG